MYATQPNMYPSPGVTVHNLQPAPMRSAPTGFDFSRGGYPGSRVIDQTRPATRATSFPATMPGPSSFQNPPPTFNVSESFAGVPSTTIAALPVRQTSSFPNQAGSEQVASRPKAPSSLNRTAAPVRAEDLPSPSSLSKSGTLGRAEDFPGAVGVLSISVIAAYNLPESTESRLDSHGGRFVEVSVHGPVLRTKDSPDCLNPRWNSQPFDFAIDAEMRRRGDGVLVVEVKDSALPRNDASLGRLEVSVEAVVEAASEGRVLPIRAKLKDAREHGGELEVEVGFRRFQNRPAQQKAETPGQKMPGYHQAHGFQHPQHKVPIPSFNQGTYDCVARPPREEEVKAHEYKSSACHLGQHDYSTAPMYTPMQKKQNKKKWVDDPFYGWRHDEHKAAKPAQHGHKDQRQQGDASVVILEVTIVAAYDLPQPDGWFGKSLPDPYATIALEGQRHQTRVCDPTLNPKWNAVPFGFKLGPLQQGKNLRLEVKDYNHIASDVLLGVLEVSVDTLLSSSDLKVKNKVAIKDHLMQPDQGANPHQKLTSEIEFEVRILSDETQDQDAEKKRWRDQPSDPRREAMARAVRQSSNGSMDGQDDIPSEGQVASWLARDDPFWEWKNHNHKDRKDQKERHQNARLASLPSFSAEPLTRFDGKHDYHPDHAAVSVDQLNQHRKEVKHQQQEARERKLVEAAETRDRQWKADPFFGWLPDRSVIQEYEQRHEGLHEHLQPLERARLARLPSFSDPSGHGHRVGMGMLRVQVKSARNLTMSNDARQRGHVAPDTFVRLCLGATEHRTALVRGEQDPQYDSAVLAFVVDSSEETLECQVCCVLAGASGQEDIRLLGKTRFLVKELGANSGVWKQERCYLEVDGNPGQQELNIAYFYQGNEASEDVRASEGTLPRQYTNSPTAKSTSSSKKVSSPKQTAAPLSQEPRQMSKGPTSSGKSIGTLGVRVVAAYDLVNMDSGILGDVSDPYVTATLGSQSFKTPTISNNLNPRWQCGAFTFDVCHNQEVLQLTVMDEDMLTSDDFLGRLEIPLDGVLEKLAQLGSQSMTVRNKLYDIDHGELEVELSYNPTMTYNGAY